MAGKQINQHTHRPLQTPKWLPAFSGKPSDLEETEIRMIGGAPFVRWARVNQASNSSNTARRKAPGQLLHRPSHKIFRYYLPILKPWTKSQNQLDIKTFMTQSLMIALKPRIPTASTIPHQGLLGKVTNKRHYRARKISTFPWKGKNHCRWKI